MTIVIVLRSNDLCRSQPEAERMSTTDSSIADSSSEQDDGAPTTRTAGGGAKRRGANGAQKNGAGKNGAGKNGAEDWRSGSKSGASAPRQGRGEPSCETLLARYRRKPSVRLRDRIVERHRPFVESLARSLATRLPRSVDVDDLVHAGLWGLMKAIEKFRAERGAPFQTFMRPRIRGAMLDELRTMDFLPRLYRQRLREREAAVSRLRGNLHRDPYDGELAAELGITESRLRQSYSPLPAIQGASRIPVRPAENDSGGEFDLIEFVPDDRESPIEAIHRQEMLAKIEASLQPIEWTVLRKHYLEGKSGKEVARELRLSASRICQIHVRVLSRLKERLGAFAY
jgi:RNA polymerase sigma factor for flagellar operon FliA